MATPATRQADATSAGSRLTALEGPRKRQKTCVPGLDYERARSVDRALAVHGVRCARRAHSPQRQAEGAATQRIWAARVNITELDESPSPPAFRVGTRRLPVFDRSAIPRSHLA